jgi:hypothetical protein
LILRAVLRHVSSMVIRLISVSDHMQIPEFHDAFRAIVGWHGDLGDIIRVHGQQLDSFRRKIQSKTLHQFQLHRPTVIGPSGRGFPSPPAPDGDRSLQWAHTIETEFVPSELKNLKEPHPLGFRIGGIARRSASCQARGRLFQLVEYSMPRRFRRCRRSPARL